MKPLIPVTTQSSDGAFYDENKVTGEEGTIVDAAYMNSMQGAVRSIQSELLTLLGFAGINADGSSTTQLMMALDWRYAKLTGLTQKLDIADIAGIPLPWPQASAPAGWLKCNGQAFDKTLYPRLAALYQSGVLPDLRGEFIRGWDDGRGVDMGRGLMSAQGDAIQNHGHGDMRYSGQAASGGNLPIIDGGGAFSGGGDLIGVYR
ncbi:phage tail protein [Dickeya aquatica]|uniref:Phage tail fiber protein n=1 Tax=Dickeya aquatica TaxID=1401087 RepID=A0A375AAJ4_9GAMM|nr:Phage tail fiber protein [Dickeya aquatica]